MAGLDAKDAKIIAILRKDSRTTVRAIAKKTGIKPSTVHQRIASLRKKGVIERFTIKLDNDLVDEGFIVLMFLNPKQDLTDAFLGSSHVKEVFAVTGEYELMLKLKFRDVSEFERFSNDMKKKRLVSEVMTVISTSTIKEEI